MLCINIAIVFFHGINVSLQYNCLWSPPQKEDNNQQARNISMMLVKVDVICFFGWLKKGNNYVRPMAW